MGLSNRSVRALARGTVIAALGAAVLLTVRPLSAQGPDSRLPSRLSGSLALLNTQPLGELATGPGLGVGLSAALAVDRTRRLRLRGELRAGIYGRDTRTACLSQTVGCLIQVDINTDYTTLYVGLGPEVAVPLLGTTLVLDATAGVANFSASSSVEGTSGLDNEDLFKTDHFSDTFFAWSVGGEVRVPVSAQFAIALGAHYQHNGEASYVPEGGVTQNPDGSVAVNELTTDANQMAFTLGVAFHPFAGGR